MMRYLRRQKQSVISKTGFKRRFYLPATLLLLGAVILPLIAVPDVPWAYGRRFPVSVQNLEEVSIQQTLSKPAALDNEQQYVFRENDVLRDAKILQQRVSFRYRHQQVRLLVWYIIIGLLLLPVLLFTYCGEGKRRQQELISRSLQIVRYRNRSDGKKEGIAFSIK